MISLATPRAVLRPWTDEDVAAFVELCGDPVVMRYIGDGRPKAPAEAEASFRRLDESWSRSGYGLFALERLDTGEFAGFSGLLDPDFLPEIMPAVEIGWRLTRDSWGLGLGTEAAAAVLDWAFDTLDVPDVVAVIHIENARSQRVAEKLGMRKERRTIVPDHGVWVDVYALDAQTWSTAVSR